MRCARVMVVTTGRADYWLLRPLLAWLAGRGKLDVRLAATGDHLSGAHGASIRTVEQDSPVGVAAVVDMVPDGDSEDAVSRAVAAGIEGFSRLFRESRPDMLVVLGDRYELWAACVPAVIHRIPIAHIHGGEVTRGAFDDAIRHAVTKMASLHFAALDLYGRRIVQMGEDPDRVFVVGALGVDTIMAVEPMDREELSACTGMDFSRPVALMTFHPATLDGRDEAGRQVAAVLDALLETNLAVLVTMPNTDPASGLVGEEIRRYVRCHPERFVLAGHLGARAYLGAMRHARLMVGNSSSGIIEAASFRLPVVNVGDRQAGRYKPRNVIDCACDKAAVAAALDRALSPGFRASLADLESPYGDGRAAERIGRVIETVLAGEGSVLLKKGFHDLEVGPDPIRPDSRVGGSLRPGASQVAR